MLDIKYIRDHREELKENYVHRRATADIDELLALDDKRRAMIAEVDALRSTRNHGSKGRPSDTEILRMRQIGEEIKEKEAELQKIEEKYRLLLSRMPNRIHPDTPIGNDEAGNVVVRTIGNPPAFSFPPKEHWDLGAMRGLIDTERAAKVSGSRFAYLKSDLVRLQFALIQHVLSFVTNEPALKRIIKKQKLGVSSRPFTPVIPPVMIRPEIMQKMARLEPKEERYHIPSDDLYLVGSAEHTLGPIHMDETIEEKNLPIRYLGYSTAFRREAGSYGKDTKGILRLHQFDKLEFESFTTAEQGEEEQNFLIALQEHLMQSLGIPYRVVRKCTGDMGAPDYREFDIEAWLPGQKTYRETHTSDYMTDYQSRRLNIKVKKENGQTEFAHMNDATVFAIGRTLIAIMENYQKHDGRIAIPKVLQPYLGKKIV